MKRKIKNILYLCLLGGFVFTGCNSFLDVQPKGEVIDDKMFEDIQGYRDAMYGIYATLGTSALYGQNLSWGFVDQLAHLYYNPSIGDLNSFNKILSYNYTEPDVEKKINDIWGKAYQAISYINNVLSHVTDEQLNSKQEYRWIAGEAHALRAFLHFDMMRYFADNILDNPDAGGIPYAYTFDLQNKELFTLKECYENVLEDLTEAQHLLADDTLNLSGEYRRDRYNFMNLHAVYASKARVFQAYGHLDSAGYYAQKVIATKMHYLADPTGLKNVKKYPGGSELIWGLDVDNLYDVFYSTFLSVSATNFNYILPRKDYKAVYKYGSFTSENHDYRYDEFFGLQKDPENEEAPVKEVFIRFLKVNVNDSKDVEKQKENTKGVSLIRLPEMYYIAAEAICEDNLEKAWEYLNDVRASRGLGTALQGDLSAFQKALQEERIKELWGDGQIFMDYKRTNATFLDCQQHNNIVMNDKIGTFPWPDNEKEYGYTNK